MSLCPKCNRKTDGYFCANCPGDITTPPPSAYQPDYFEADHGDPNLIPGGDEFENHADIRGYDY